MTTVLDPRGSEFETDEQAARHDLWFRTKVQEAIDSQKPRLPHDEAMARVDRLLEARRRQHHAAGWGPRAVHGGCRFET
ncbi:MAG: stability determinant [Roseateles sp.]|uniref:type II toxin-antitoxin system RelB family antitoxin n=1 Tax=Roseateles sp. TaxID=1971397 RepID=UPI0039E8D3FA